MKKINTQYILVDNKRWTVLLTESHEDEIPRYSLHEYGEPCSGMLKHWDTKENHIEFLERIIKELKKLK